MGGECSTKWDKRNVYKNWWAIQKKRNHWVDNIKMDLREIAWGGMDWINLAQDGD
jgi:hypothetical protein